MPGALGYLQFHPVASVDRHIVRALQKAADRLRWEITGVDVSLGVREAHTAESYGETEKQTAIRIQGAAAHPLRNSLTDRLWGGAPTLGSLCFTVHPHPTHPQKQPRLLLGNRKEKLQGKRG